MPSRRVIVTVGSNKKIRKLDDGGYVEGGRKVELNPICHRSKNRTIEKRLPPSTDFL